MSGLGWGELAALRPVDIDFSRNVILVQPISRNTFPRGGGCRRSNGPGLRRHVRLPDLRGAHASWPLAGGADLEVVMDRLGHRQITTTHQQYLGSLPDEQSMTLGEAWAGSTSVPWRSFRSRIAGTALVTRGRLTVPVNDSFIPWV